MVPEQTNGPVAHFSTLPVQAIVEQLRAAGIPADMSLSAGTCVCNYVFYAVMRTLDRASSSSRARFIHLPALPGQVVATPHPSTGLDVQVSAMEIVLGAL